MEAAMGLPPPPPLLKLSDAFSRENMVRASGKLGGVAGVLAGVHIWKARGKVLEKWIRVPGVGSTYTTEN